MTGMIAGTDSSLLIFGLPGFFFMKEAMEEDAPAYLAALSGVKGFFGCGMMEVTEWWKWQQRCFGEDFAQIGSYFIGWQLEA